MSEIKALDKLRKYNLCYQGEKYTFYDSANKIADEIEAEIAEAIETTRKKHRAERVYWQNELHKILDTINGQERFWGACMDYPLPEATIPPSEIAKRMLLERYMLLPVDSNNEPIHVGDTVSSPVSPLHNEHEVIAVNDYCAFVRDADENLMDIGCKVLCHVKPRTLEDVLRDVWKEALNYAKSDIWRNPDEVFAERADEIRELLLGSDAE